MPRNQILRHVCRKCKATTTAQGSYCRECKTKDDPVELQDDNVPRQLLMQKTNITVILDERRKICPHCGGIRIVDADLRIYCLTCGRDTWELVQETADPQLKWGGRHDGPQY